MARPPEDKEANLRKRRTEDRVSELLDIDPKVIREMVTAAVGNIEEPYRIVVTGGAGSNKTTFGEMLGEKFSVPSFDLDEFVPGGGTEDRKEFLRRLGEGVSNLWEEIPTGRGWIIEHIEACHPEIIAAFRPAWAIRLTPGTKHLLSVASARDRVGTDTAGVRARRAVETADRAEEQFGALSATRTMVAPGWSLKKLLQEQS